MNIEASLISYLNNFYSTFADVPIEKPEQFLTVELTGGSEDNYVRETPLVAVQCWADTREKAAAMAYQVKAAMKMYAFEPGVHNCSLNSMYNYPSEKNEPRYQLVYDIVCRG